jgi:hypothetical protein
MAFSSVRMIIFDYRYFNELSEKSPIKEERGSFTKSITTMCRSNPARPLRDTYPLEELFNFTYSDFVSAYAYRNV